MHALITIWIAVLGLCIGSFLNVVIGRLPQDDDIDAPDPGDSWWEGWKQSFRFSGRALKRLAWPPSHCPKCKHQLKWYENVPVLAWLALRGKCKNCKLPISPRYLFVELLTGALFVAVTTRFPYDWQLVSALTFLTFLIPLIFIDAELWILPFELTLPGIAAGVGLAFLFPQGPEAALIGAAGGFLVFRAMEIFGWFLTSRVVTDQNGVKRRMGREALGAGDKYLLAMIGAQVGPRALLGVILLSSLQGAVVGIARMKLTGSAGPQEPEVKEDAKPDEPEDPADEGLYPFTPSFLAPGLPWWKRVVLVPVTILFQDIPDSPPPDETTGEVPDWEPQANNMPFGPWLGLAAVEVMLLGPWIVSQTAHSAFSTTMSIVFGQ